MSDALKIISGLDAVVFATVLILIRALFNRFHSLEEKILTLPKLYAELDLLSLKLNQINKILDAITEVHVKTQNKPNQDKSI